MKTNAESIIMKYEESLIEYFKKIWKQYKEEIIIKEIVYSDLKYGNAEYGDTIVQITSFLQERINKESEEGKDAKDSEIIDFITKNERNDSHIWMKLVEISKAYLYL